MRRIDPGQHVDLNRVRTQPKALSLDSFECRPDLDPVTAMIDEVALRSDQQFGVVTHLNADNYWVERIASALHGEGARARQLWGRVARAIALVPATATRAGAPDQQVWTIVTEGGESVGLTTGMIEAFNLASPLLGGLVPLVAQGYASTGEHVSSLVIQLWLSPEERAERVNRLPELADQDGDPFLISHVEDFPWEDDSVLPNGELTSLDPITEGQKASADALFPSLTVVQVFEASTNRGSHWDFVTHPVDSAIARPQALLFYLRAPVPTWPR